MIWDEAAPSSAVARPINGHSYSGRWYISASRCVNRGRGRVVTIQQEGTTQVVFTATDSASNVSTLQKATIMLDKTAPVVTYAGNTGTYTADQNATSPPAARAR